MHDQEEPGILRIPEQRLELGIIKRATSGSRRQRNSAEAVIVDGLAQLIDRLRRFSQTRDRNRFHQALGFGRNRGLCLVNGMHPLLRGDAARPGNLSRWRSEQLPFDLSAFETVETMREVVQVLVERSRRLVSRATD